MTVVTVLNVLIGSLIKSILKTGLLMLANVITLAAVIVCMVV